MSTKLPVFPLYPVPKEKMHRVDETPTWVNQPKWAPATKANGGLRGSSATK